MDARARETADFPARRPFTNVDVVRMIAAGVIGEEESFELLGGEIVPRAPEMDKHGYARGVFLRPFVRSLGDEFLVATELSLFLFDNTEVKPDLHIFPSAMASDQVRGKDVLLAVEIASSSHRRDFELKLPLYAEGGVGELWILDLDAGRAHVYRDPEGRAYRSHSHVGADEAISPRAFPHISIKVADLLRKLNAR